MEVLSGTWNRLISAVAASAPPQPALVKVHATRLSHSESLGALAHRFGVAGPTVPCRPENSTTATMLEWEDSTAPQKREEGPGGAFGALGPHNWAGGSLRLSSL
jgi:hypothetical protein